MIIVGSLRHNRFKEVDVPKPSELYQRFGFGVGTKRVSGDEFLDPSLSKVEQAAQVQEEVDKLPPADSEDSD